MGGESVRISKHSVQERTFGIRGRLLATCARRKLLDPRQAEACIPSSFLPRRTDKRIKPVLPLLLTILVRPDPATVVRSKSDRIEIEMYSQEPPEGALCFRI